MSQVYTLTPHIPLVLSVPKTLRSGCHSFCLLFRQEGEEKKFSVLLFSVLLEKKTFLKDNRKTPEKNKRHLFFHFLSYDQPPAWQLHWNCWLFNISFENNIINFSLFDPLHTKIGDMVCVDLWRKKVITLCLPWTFCRCKSGVFRVQFAVFKTSTQESIQ